MSSSFHHEEDQIITNDAAVAAAATAVTIPLVAASSQNKKQASKQKLRVRPVRTLQKNTQRKALSTTIGLSKSGAGGIGAAAVVTAGTATSSGAAAATNDGNPNAQVVSQSISAPVTSSDNHGNWNNDDNNNNSSSSGSSTDNHEGNQMKIGTVDLLPTGKATASVAVPKEDGSKPVSVKKATVVHKRTLAHSSLSRATNVTLSNVRKGLSIHVGSAVISSQKRPSSVIHPNNNNNNNNNKSSVHPTEDNRDNMIEESIESSMIEKDLPPASSAESDAAMDAADKETQQTTHDPSSEKDEIVPYQHLGLIDPSLKIAPPKPNEKTMKDFCSKFKLPKVSKGNANGQGNGGGGGGGSGNHPVGNPKSFNVHEEEEVRDHRSGPLVEIINGEIVIQESSIIVGGRRTTEEVDRELEGGIVEEENTALTATYTSFTNRIKVKRWTVEETKKFYLVLRQCGTDFSTMENFFDGSDGGNKRSRKELKCKYNRERRKHPTLIDMAMNPKVQLPYDLSVFGELDMDAVQDNVVPLGHARVRGQGTVTDGSASGSNVTIQQTPISVTPVSSVVTVGNHEEVEQGGVEERNALAVVSQQETQAMDVECTMNDDTDKDAAGVVVESGGEGMILEESTSGDGVHKHSLSSIPLLAPAAAKKKMKPKFRAKPNALNVKGSLHPKRIVK
jgi:hypothetical protein